MTNLAVQENTLVNDARDAVLCDFGLAKILEDVPSGLTTTSTSACTLRYAAPELIQGDGSPRTLASDVWAWACLLLGVSMELRSLVLGTDGHPIDHDRCHSVRNKGA